MRHPLALALLALAAGTLEAQPGLASFEPIGGPEGAFTYALFVEPDGDVLAGSYDGYASAYRSRDGGASWAYVEALPNGRYHAFVEAPSGDLFALTSSDVVRSSDGGDTWTRAPGSSAISGLNDLVVTAGGALLVSSSYTGAHRSTDGGETWAEATAGLDTLRASALTVTPSGRVYLAGLGGHVHASDDGGGSWTPTYAGLPDAYVYALAPTPGGRVLAATQRGLFATDDDGASWSRVEAGLGSASESGFYAVVALPSGRLLASSYREVYHSDDDGTTWTASGAAQRPVGAYAMTADGDGTVYAGSFGGGIFRSDDGGLTWTGSTAGLDNTDVAALIVDSQGRLLVGTAQSQTPNAQRWDPATGTFTALASLVTSYVQAWVRTATGALIAGTGRGIYRSTDDGLSWTQSAGLQVSIQSLAAAPDGSLFAGAYDQGIARSTDDGETWTLVDAPETRVYAIAAGPDGTLYAGLRTYGAGPDPGVTRSTDGGDSWSYINGWGPVPRNAASLAVDASGALVASFYGVAAYRSSDRGDTWTATVGLERPVLLHAIGHAIFAAQDDGDVLKSTDGGATWTAVAEAPLGVYPTALAADADDRVYIGTSGRGVFRSSVGAVAREPGGLEAPGLAVRAAPSPFATTTTLEVDLGAAADLRAEVYDLRGRLIEAVDAGAAPAGRHRVVVGADDWPVGMYLVRVVAGPEARTVRVVRVR